MNYSKQMAIIWFCLGGIIFIEVGVKMGSVIADRTYVQRLVYTAKQAAHEVQHVGKETDQNSGGETTPPSPDHKELEEIRGVIRRAADLLAVERRRTP